LDGDLWAFNLQKNPVNRLPLWQSINRKKYRTLSFLCIQIIVVSGYAVFLARKYLTKTMMDANEEMAMAT